MLTFTLSSPQPSSIYNKHTLSLKNRAPRQHRQPNFTQNSAYLGFNPVRVWIQSKELVSNKRRRVVGPVCYSSPLTPHNLEWICTISSTILMLVRGTAIQKSFLVPLFALQAPTRIISWIKGDYGIWTAFLALLVRLFFYIPGELELPFMAFLMVIVAPYQAMNLRGTQEGVILSLVIAGYLAFQHCSRAGNLQKVFERGSIIATLGIICIVAVPCLLLIGL